MVEIFISYSYFELYHFKSNDVFELKMTLGLEEYTKIHTT